MKTFLFSLLVLLFAPVAHAQLHFGFSVDHDGLSEFYLGIGRHYHVPAHEVMIVHEYGIPFDEVPVVYFIARHACVPPVRIVRLRHRGYSWMRICTRYRLSPSIFYVPVRYYGAGCGAAFGHFSRPRHHWHSLRFSDGDIIHMVNIRFASEYRGYAPDDVIRVRDNGFSYADMQHGSFNFERATRTRDRDVVFDRGGSTRTRDDNGIREQGGTRLRGNDDASIDRGSTRARELDGSAAGRGGVETRESGNSGGRTGTSDGRVTDRERTRTTIAHESPTRAWTRGGDANEAIENRAAVRSRERAERTREGVITRPNVETRARTNEHRSSGDSRRSGGGMETREETRSRDRR